MKKIRIYILSLIGLLGLIGMEACKKPELPTENAVKVSISFDEIVSGSGQKLFIDGSDASIYWTTGDQLKFVSSTRNITLNYSGIQQGVAYFSHSGDPLELWTQYTGVHPTNAIVDGTQITYTTPDPYTINSSNPDAYITTNLLMHTNPVYRRKDSDTAFFRPDMALLQIPFQTDSATYKITSIKLIAIRDPHYYGYAFYKEATIRNLTPESAVDATSWMDTITYNFTGDGLSVGTSPTTIKLLIWSYPNVTALTKYEILINGIIKKNIKLPTTGKGFSNSIYYKLPVLTISTKPQPPDPPQSLKIGDSYGGGYIFHIFTSGQTGYVAGETHGLIVATSKLSSKFTWGCSGTIVGNDTSIGSGQANTARMITAGCGGAAYACDTFTGGGYTDWFLPSSAELRKIYFNITFGNVTTITGGDYWSSSEGFGWANKSDYGVYVTLSQWNTGPPQPKEKTEPYYVIPVRAF